MQSINQAQTANDSYKNRSLNDSKRYLKGPINPHDNQAMTPMDASIEQ